MKMVHGAPDADHRKGGARTRLLPVLLLCIGCMVILVQPVAAGPPAGKWGNRGAGTSPVAATSQAVSTDAVQAQALAGIVSVQNDYLQIMENLGDSRFALSTTGGDPANALDDNQMLLYSEGGPGTSFTTLQVDGVDNHIETARTYLQAPAVVGTSIGSVWTGNGIQVTQNVSLVSNPATGRPDTMEIRYQLKNTDSVSHDVGLRVLLDTMLGQNDGAPFYIPGTGAVTMETELSGSAIPDYFIAFDSLSAPTVLSQGTLRGGAATPPDRLVFAGWQGISNNLWDYTIHQGEPLGTYSNGKLVPDSAYALYWNPVTLGPGSTKEYVTYYGLSGLSESAPSPTNLLNLAVTGPLSIDVVNGLYSPDPFTVTAILEDMSGAGISGLEVRINLPAGLSLAGSQQVQDLDLGPGEISQVVWSIHPGTQTTDRTFTYTVFANTTTVANANRSVTRQVLVPALGGAPAPIPVKVKIVPRTINLASRGVFLAFVTLPQGTKASDVDRASVTCNGVKAVRIFTLGKFSRAFGAVFRVSDLKGVPTGAQVPFTVTGTLKSTRQGFQGTDTVRVIDQKIHGHDSCEDMQKDSDEKLFENHYRES